MGHTLTWIRRAGALRTDPLEGPYLFMPKRAAGEEYFSIPVGTYLLMADGPLDYSAPMEPVEFFPPAYTQPIYRGEEYTDSPFQFPGDEPEPPFRMAPRGGSQQYEERPRKIGKNSTTREDILKKARGKDQRMKDWKTRANKMLSDLGWDPVTAEESQREQRRRRNAAAHSRKKGRDRDIDNGSLQIHSPGATAGLAPGAERSVRIVGGVRGDLLDGVLGPQGLAAQDHMQRIARRNMRR